MDPCQGLAERWVKLVSYDCLSDDVIIGDADVAANMASAPVKRGKPAASFQVFDLMMREGETVAAAEVLFHIVR